MLTVIRNSWALLLGVMLLMLGNGVQGTLLGIRGKIEGMSTTEISYVMSAYFVGFLFGSRMMPDMLRRVGHVRVFAALGSLISAVLVLYPLLLTPWAWALMRVVIGFSFAGVYITAESWLNNASSNETRGQALSLYMIVQMLGIIGSQALLNLSDPGGYVLFIIPSILVSLAFTPILLSAAPAPSFETTKPLSFKRLYRASPLGCVGIFLLGGVYSAEFGMASVWGGAVGLSVRNISIFVAAIYVGGLVFQYPIGWASDRIGRRNLVLALSAAGTLVTLVAGLVTMPFPVLIGVAVLLGGITNPLYSLLLAYTNDFLDNSDMAAASAGLIFLNGLGAISGPIITGWLMEKVGPGGFYLIMTIFFAILAAYTGWRMARRPMAPRPQGGVAVVSPNASALAVDAVMEALNDQGPATGAGRTP